MKIEIKDARAVEKKGVSAKSGKAYLIREQIGYALFTDRNGVQKAYPTEVKIPLDDAQAPYAPGMYALSDTSFFCGKFQDIQCRPVLVALPTAAAAPGLKSAA